MGARLLDRDGHRVVPPTRRFRTIRGEASGYKTAFYTTQERRDAAAQRDADRDGDTVLCEVWDEDTATRCDPINAGWGCDSVKRPSA